MNALDGYMSLLALVAAKASVLLVAAFALGFAARNRSASARHALWAITFCFLLAIPAMGWVSAVLREVSIRIPVLAPPETESATGEAPNRTEASDAGDAPYSAHAPVSFFDRFDASILGWAWMLGTGLLMARLGFGLLASRRVFARSEPVLESEWTDRLREGCERLGIETRVALRRSDRVALPLSMGFLRPAILLPLDASAYAASRRSAVILHELAHVRRRDCASLLLGQLGAALFWWNPLVWLATREMRLLSERASDDLALGAGARPSEYAHDLLDLARGLKKDRATPLGSVAMAHRSRFEERLLAILDPRIARGAVSKHFVIAAGAAASPFVLSLAMVAPTSVIQSAPVAQVEELERPVPVEPVARAQEPEVLEEPGERQAPEKSEQKGSESAADQSAIDAAKAALGEALDDPEESVREQALHALVQLGDESVAPYLEKALSDANPSARAQAAWGLGHLRREESASALSTALRDADEEVRSQAAWALGMIRTRAGVPGLIAALSDESAEVKSQAAWALGMIRDPSAVEALSRALKDSDADVREQAAWALGVIVLGEDDDDDDDDEDDLDPVVVPEPPASPEPKIVLERTGGRALRGASF